MNIIHGTWIPEQSSLFKNGGAFCIWIESVSNRNKGTNNNTHPFALQEKELLLFFEAMRFNEKVTGNIYKCGEKHFSLPSVESEPLLSIEMMICQGIEIPEKYNWHQWKIPCVEAFTPLAFIKEAYFLSARSRAEFQIGSDLLFWYHYGRAIREIILKDQYIPALKAHPSTKQSNKRFDCEYLWQFISPRYQTLLEEYAPLMPLSCRSGQSGENKSSSFYKPNTLLQHFSEQLLDNLVSETTLTQQEIHSVDKTLVERCIPNPWRQKELLNGERLLLRFRQWFSWKKALESSHTDTSFILGFRLDSPDKNHPDVWTINFLVESREDPSLKIDLVQYWKMNTKAKIDLKPYFGKDFEKNFLVQMGVASRIYPKLWEGLESGNPNNMLLTLSESFDFLNETAWVLEDSGFRIIVPAWMTEEGQQRAKLRMKISGVTPPSQKMPSGRFNLPTLAKYEYQFSIGDEEVSEEEWKALVEAKSPMVQFRGQWMMLNQEKMAQILSFWKEQNQQTHIEISELIKKEAQESENIVFEFDDALSGMMAHLHHKSRFTLTEEPKDFNGSLREYQNRGVSWLVYLETLGMGSCLADDMGLGKTIQIIALLLHERQYNQYVLPTLLVAPTSVLGNWQKELERFSPTLKSMIHHGGQRLNELNSFSNVRSNVDVIITSYALIRVDSELFKAFKWHRIVIDEAQNIKNPESAQTKSILELRSQHRIALTGTPIENRLMDLWSIFNFLNSGYLGTQGNFHSVYELPIQKENDSNSLVELKQLVEPFLLRRVKTDKAIIKDLPDKVEQKVYCTLSKEQASLYQTVVDEVKEALKGVDGIKRKGLILSTLTKLKQICNHPAQFLQDGSEFSEERSHKMGRLVDMIEEVIENKESVLIFTQFTEIGAEIDKLFQSKHITTWYLHGGTTRKKRESLVEAFQDKDSPSGVFILSLKAGGVGITLTKANHVFHFDRWWNPAVENQATDRAFRIGQQKNVFVHKFVSTGTLEERIDALLEDKQNLSDSIVGSDEAWLSELDDEAFRKLIELNHNTAFE